MERKPQQSKPLTSDDKARAVQDRSAIKGDYKKWKDSLSHNDLVAWAKMCYNEYTEYGNDLSLPRDVRNSYLDRAHSFKSMIDYIERQA